MRSAPPTARSRARGYAVIALLTALTACQGMDRLEPDRATGADAAPAERGTLFDASGSPGFGGGGRLTQEIASRWLRQIEGAPAAERLELAGQFLREYPDGTVLSYLHEMVGDAHRELDNPAAAADAYVRAIDTSWPAPDLLGLPLTALELPYEVGWARFDSGEAQQAADWLVRATFVSDRPQLDQGLRYLYAELGSPGEGFDAWLQFRRSQLASRAPGFELPGYQSDLVRMVDPDARLTLVNFWSPT